MADLAGRLWDLLGTLHPMLVHFPIALLIAAAFFEMFRLRRKGPASDQALSPRFQAASQNHHLPSHAAVACTVLGAISAGVAVASGWRLAEAAEASNRLEVHRWVGVAAAVVGMFAGVVGLVAQWRPGPRMLAWYRLVVVGGAITVGAAGHFGGELVWGAGYFAKAARTAFFGPAGPDGGVSVDAGGPEGTVNFAREVFPILSRRCFACHSGEDHKSGLLLDSREAMLRGGDSKEPAIIPGDAAKSLLIRLVSGEDADRLMPPRGDELTSEQIKTLSTWINEGARWGAAGAASAQGPGAGAKSDSHWHWSYASPAKPATPKVTRASWVKGEIDRHVLASLEAQKLTPSPEADRATLLRRLSLDLVGIPPTPEEIDAFIADTASDATEKVVDRLLANPHYGERWARVWLDLARYADTHGYEKDARRVMWPYRDWVIEAYNQDMPFDRFTVEQLAGDMLPGATLAQKIATGFNRNTQINEEGGTDPEEFRVEAVLDRVNTVSSVWLGTTLACAQCHDHKYDPLPHKDYFKFYAFFNQDEADAVVVNDTATEKQAGGPMVGVPQRQNWGEFENLVAQAAVLRSSTTQSPEPAALEALEKRIAELTIAKTFVMGKNAKPRETHIFQRGSFLSPGEIVTPEVPEVLVAAAGEAPTPDRLGLARWLVDAKNPLTARVQVNRLWATLFGRGLVETEEDFGTQGEHPTHPALLDYLAVRYIELGWSQKALLREIVLSATYRQSSRVSKELLEKDPANKLLARAGRFRVEAEMVRDIALSASGLLSPKMYGESVFPPQPPGIWTMIYSADKWTESAGEDRFRRGLYTFARRTAPYSTFAGFDAPSREVSCTRRSRTNTPLQALTTMNDPQFVEAAGALAVRMIREGSTTTTRVARGMRLAIGRVPEPAEVVRLVLLAEEQLAAYAKDPASAEKLAAQIPKRPTDVPAADLAAWTIVGNVILNLDETITRE